MQVLKRPVDVVQRIRLNQDYGLIRLEEVVVERVRTHGEDSMCYTQKVEQLQPQIIVYDIWLGWVDFSKYETIKCGQSEELWFCAHCQFCYVNYITFECYAGKDTGWENLIRRVEHYPIICGEGCCEKMIGMMVPWYGTGDPRSGKVEEFLKLAGLDCTATQVKVCAKVIYEG